MLRLEFLRWSLGIFVVSAGLTRGYGVPNKPVAQTFRSDRVSLHGEWKFQLRHDNQLTTSGAVKFGPVSASSQAAFIAPASMGQTSAGRWQTAVPWGVAVTLLGTEGGGLGSQQAWKPHPQQQGPTWWRADFGSKQRLASVRVQWARPGQEAIATEISDDGSQWKAWARGESKPDESETDISGPPSAARYLRLTFMPAQFDGTKRIAAYLQEEGSGQVIWEPRVQRVWYEDLRRFTPSDDFHLPGFNDAGWSTIRVPGYWEVQRFSEPTWWQPDDAVGYYRRTFTLPEPWRDRVVRLRFEGVNNSAQVWVNGREIGYHESGFTAFEYDVTPHVQFGTSNVITVRVAKWTLTHEYDTDDMWFLGGIWRDCYLYSLPRDRIEDFRIRTELDSQYRDAVLRVQLQLRGGEAARARSAQVEGSLFDGEGKEVPLAGLQAQTNLAGREPIPAELAALVKNPRKWTAETPYLYFLVLRLKVDGSVVQEFKSSVGFRQVEVRANRLLLNGVPLKLHGSVTTRATPSDAGESQKDVFEREIRLLKEANINAIRSHTTPLEEDFLDLCDRYGIYIIPDVPYVWVNEYDFRFLTDGAVLRAREIYEQHKNRACVIAWHIGNENGLSSSYRGMGEAARWLHEADSTRPVAVCLNRADLVEFGTEINDIHYYPPHLLEDFRNETTAPTLAAEFHGVPEEIERLDDHGLVETWGNGLLRVWNEMDQRPWVAGALICCWEDGSVNGNLGPRQWGLVDSKRQPKAVHYQTRKVFAAVRLDLKDPKIEGARLKGTLAVTNKYSFTDLEGFEFQWELLKAGKPVGSGELTYRVEPGRTASFPLSLGAPAGGERLRIKVYDGAGFFVQNQEFKIPGGLTPPSLATLLRKIGITESYPMALSPRDPEVKGSAYRARWDGEGRLTVLDRLGRELLHVGGIVLLRAAAKEGWSQPSVPVGPVRYEKARVEHNTLTTPFLIDGKTREGQAVRITGSLRLQFSSSQIRVSYEFEPQSPVAIRESGLRLSPGESLLHLGWNREALWDSTPDDWHDSSLEQGILLDAFARSISRRNLIWTTFGGEAAGVLITPIAPTIHLRAGGDAREFVLSDYLAEGDFLGKEDRQSIEKRLGAGEKFTGGFVLYLLTRRQAAALEKLPAPEKDLTWNRATPQ